MNQIDITIKKVCDYCKVEYSFHHPYAVPLITISEHSVTTLSIPETFVDCPNCERPLYLRIQGQPYDIHNHTNGSLAMELLVQQLDQKGQ